jgi:hypothetical protein
MGFLLRTDASVLIHKARNSVELRVYMKNATDEALLFKLSSQDFGNIVKLVCAVSRRLDCSCVGQGRKSKFRKPFRSRSETV